MAYSTRHEAEFDLIFLIVYKMIRKKKRNEGQSVSPDSLAVVRLPVPAMTAVLQSHVRPPQPWPWERSELSGSGAKGWKGSSGRRTEHQCPPPVLRILAESFDGKLKRSVSPGSAADTKASHIFRQTGLGAAQPAL